MSDLASFTYEISTYIKHVLFEKLLPWHLLKINSFNEKILFPLLIIFFAKHAACMSSFLCCLRSISLLVFFHDDVKGVVEVLSEYVLRT